MGLFAPQTLRVTFKDASLELAFLFSIFTGVFLPDDKILFGIAPKSIQKNLEKSARA